MALNSARINFLFANPANNKPQTANPVIWHGKMIEAGNIYDGLVPSHSKQSILKYSISNRMEVFSIREPRIRWMSERRMIGTTTVECWENSRFIFFWFLYFWFPYSQSRFKKSSCLKFLQRSSTCPLIYQVIRMRSSLFQEVSLLTVTFCC